MISAHVQPYHLEIDRYKMKAEFLNSNFMKVKHMHNSIPLILAIAAVLGAQTANGAVLEALPEHRRPDPFGGVVAADRPVSGPLFTQRMALETARGNYVSCHLVVKVPEGGVYTLRLELPAEMRAFEADLFREWFHLNIADKAYYPDALIPVTWPYRSQIPDPENRVERQTAQAFWLDIWVPAQATPGEYVINAVLESPATRSVLPVSVRVLAALTPAEDAVVIDHNSYGSSWLADFFPSVRGKEGKSFFTSDAFFQLIHAYHRIFFEHRGIYHQLGYGHGGKVAPEFAPALEGAGRNRRIANWDLYDRHYGPLLDGSAFRGSRRPAIPLPFVYLPINPEWPASFVNWGEPGYEAEFINVISAMEQHFREKGWTKTHFEMFFNHKKRYKAFPWDGDEARFYEDFAYLREYRRMLNRAVPSGSPVKFVSRVDASWTMERQFKELGGIIDFWVCAGSMFAWYKTALPVLKGRGDIVWHYGGTPAVNEPSSSITLEPLRAWMWGSDGYVRWLTTAAGADPWFHFDGGGTALVYPGERFAIAGPVPSVRLKLQRNAAADLALLNAQKERDLLRAEVARRFNGTTPDQWWQPRPALADTPPIEWSNVDIDKACRPYSRQFDKLDPAAWQNVREYLLARVKEGR
jgi:hypothetical protein